MKRNQNNKNLRPALWAGALLLAAAEVFAAGRAGDFPPSEVNVNDLASLQRGAKLFVNYCAGCHSMEFVRYSRLAEDLELSEEMVMSNLVFGDKKIGDTMTNAMTKKQGEEWFGKAPPDLSVTGRSRGPDWIHAYLLSYYRQEDGSWNNTVLENSAMPHVTWDLQGIQEPVYEMQTVDGAQKQVMTGLEVVEAGTMSPEEYKVAMRDLTAFLTYSAEPAVLKRKSIGVWVMAFLAVFALIAYLLKAEYWRDVH
ncbi:MAG: cytochrome c1 [Xanthomonadales bacterium]|jgi:ubiquinol-cytochrome c reductase cytochrome c1 subunit|nr:cytochrome c1 [Xanthomonadales bacterium]